VSTVKRATIYLEAPLHGALRLRSEETDSSISELVNAAVRQSLAEDVDDLAAFREREDEERVTFESVVRVVHRR
jgi:hypothetical protein